MTSFGGFGDILPLDPFFAKDVLEKQLTSSTYKYLLDMSDPFRIEPQELSFHSVVSNGNLHTVQSSLDARIFADALETIKQGVIAELMNMRLQDEVVDEQKIDNRKVQCSEDQLASDQEIIASFDIIHSCTDQSLDCGAEGFKRNIDNSVNYEAGDIVSDFGDLLSGQCEQILQLSQQELNLVGRRLAQFVETDLINQHSLKQCLDALVSEQCANPNEDRICQIRAINDELKAYIIQQVLSDLDLEALNQTNLDAPTAVQIDKSWKLVADESVTRSESTSAWMTANPSKAALGSLEEQSILGFRENVEATHNVSTSTAQTENSFNKGLRAQIAEVTGYDARLHRGEVGIIAPSGSTINGPDYVTASLNSDGSCDIFIVDNKSRYTHNPFPNLPLEPKESWLAVVDKAINLFDHKDTALKDAIVNAWEQRNYRLVRDTVDFTTSGQGSLCLDEEEYHPEK